MLAPPVLLIVVIASLLAEGPPTEQTAPTSTTTTTWRQPAEGCVPVEQLDERQRLGQLVMVHVAGAPLDQVASLLGRPDAPGGVLLAGTQQEGFADGRIASLVAGRPTLVAIDDEGGRVTALAEPAPSAREQARSLTPTQIRELARSRGEAMRAIGVNLDFAPVVDLTAADGGAIGDRSYGDDADQVVRDAGAFAAGLRDAGVLPTLKHFPGHGKASGDSHETTVSTPPLQRLQRADLVPYQPLAEEGEVAVMVGHLDVPGLTEVGRPASLSPATYRYLRSRIGFDGMAVTDELGAMAAVTSRFDPPGAAVAALAAGADLVLLGPADVYQPVLDALHEALVSGTLSQERVEDALGRVRRAQGCGS